MKLTDTAIRRAKPAAEPYKLTDAKGLYLQVAPTGAKLWRYRYRINGRENLFALGEYAPPSDETPEQRASRLKALRFTLQEARQQRQDARGLVKQGIHPKDARDALIAKRMADSANTFETVALEWLGEKSKKWTMKRADQIKRTFETYVFPEIGAQPINRPASESAQAILSIMSKVMIKAPVTAANIRRWCSAVFCHAIATLRADMDPTVVLKDRIELPATVHKTPLGKADIPVFLSKVDNCGYFYTTRMALKLLLLLFVRPVELRLAEWSELDLDAAEWRIPAGRMKKRDLHVVPLSNQAVALLRELKVATGGQKFVFPNIKRPDKSGMAETTLNMALRRLGYQGVFTAHGFRATASTLLHEMGHPSHLIELCLAHKERNQTKASYNQYAYMPERKKIMQDWANFIDSLTAGNVVPLNRGKAA